MKAHDDKSDHLRLIEDYLPIEAISAEASREKSVRKGHISTLHLWWARRPLVACRAAVYGALVPADRWVKDVELKNPPADPEKAERFKNGTKRGLNRRAAAEFVTRLCKYPGDPKVISQAQKHILEAHAERLTLELRDALKLPLPPGEGWGEGAPGWLNEFKWQRNRTTVTCDDILAGRAPRPRVLDMFAGGGAIPLEALRLGCDAYALDLNPVAHIIQLCTLVYPQKYGKPDPSAPGMTGPKNAKGQTTWGGLAAEVRYWGNWVLDRVRKQIGDLYPPIPDPEIWETPPQVVFDRKTGQWNVTKPGKPKRGIRLEAPPAQPPRPARMFDEDEEDDEADPAAAPIALPPGLLQPVAYLWTRTVRCKNPGCGATVPLVRQTWLCKKAKRYVALEMIASSRRPHPNPSPSGRGDVRRVAFEVVESDTEQGLGFDPAGFSKAGNATCPFCGTVADNDYVKSEGRAGRMGTQPMAVVCTRPFRQGKTYLSADGLPPLPAGEGRGEGASDRRSLYLPDDDVIRQRIAELCQRTGLTVPDEPVPQGDSFTCKTHLYGMKTWGSLFTPRQMLCLLTFTAAVREAYQSMVGQASGLSQVSTGEPPVPPSQGVAPKDEERAKAVAHSLALIQSKVSMYANTLCVWNVGKQHSVHCFGRQAMPMTWDFPEVNLANPVGNTLEALKGTATAIESTLDCNHLAVVTRSSATALPYPDGTFDAVITDPPYYDNVSYANLSDFFYVWLKRSIGHLYPEHFSSPLTPKKQEAVADASRHGKDKAQARAAYEGMMAQSLAEAQRVLKPGGTLAVVYAHKTTLGWSTLVEAFRRASFTITEAWPLQTEGYRLLALNTAALASSIFLVGRKRQVFGSTLTPALSRGERGQVVGQYESVVQPELEQIVRERVEALWDMGIAGADLVIACVGAGLRAFTKYERVEYANGEEVPAEKFLAEVEGVVLDTMLEKLMAPTRSATPPHPHPLPEGERARAQISAIDPASRFYVLWRYVYKAAEIDAGEAIVFTYAQHVELDGAGGLSDGKYALVEKKKGKYRTRDYTERGAHEKLGLPDDAGNPAPLIDILHRVLWLMEYSPRKLAEFLDEARPDRERLRVLAQALAGAALSGKSEQEMEKLIGTTIAERSALGKLLANWRSLVESRLAAEDGTLFGKQGR